MHENRILFLHEFTNELVINSLKYVGEKEKGKLEPEETTGILGKEKEDILLKEIISRPLVEKIQKKPLIKPPLRRSIRPLSPLQRRVLRPRQLHRPRITKETSPAKPGLPLRTRPPTSLPPAQPLSPSEFNLKKLNFLIKDPFVSKIECTGTGSPLLVTKSGRIKRTNIILNKEEILDIMNKFSEKAKIPIIPGIFKASVGNLLIFAPISEFAEKKFAILKRIQTAAVPRI